MNQRPYLIIGWALAALSLLAMALFPLLPERRWDVLAQPNMERFLITDQNKGGATQAQWQNKAQQHYQCRILPDAPNPFCAMQISLLDQPGRGRDFSGYNRLRFKVRYQGPGSVLRLHMRVFDPRFSKPTQPETAKFQSYVFAPSPQAQDVVIPLAGFSVADWWVREFAPRRDFAQLDFKNVILLGIDLPAPTLPGLYDIQLEALEFIGTWLAWEPLLAALIMLWVALAGTFLIASGWRVRRQWLKEYPYWRELELSIGGYKPTADFRPYNNFRDRATQCLDHTGLVLALVELLHQSIRPRLPYVVIELVASPSAGCFNGQVLGDEVQVEFAERLKRYTKDETAVVARWRGPCFIVLGMASQEQLMARLGLLRASLRVNCLSQGAQTVNTDFIVSSGILGDLEQAFGQLISSWWRVQWRKRAGLLGVKPLLLN